MVKRYWKPALSLMVLSPILAEIISGGTPAEAFVLPWILATYIVFLYGVQVLVIREVATRRKFGPLGLWCLGVIYGLYNEGVKTQTLFYPFYDDADDPFSSYGLVANVRIPLTLFITFWHGLIAVALPVFLVDYLFPKAAQKPWLSLKLTWSLAIFSVATASLVFFGLGDKVEEGMALHVVHFAFVIGAALALWSVAGRLPDTPRITSSAGAGSVGWKQFWWGGLLFVFMAPVPHLLAVLKVHWLLFVLYFAVLAIVAVLAIARHREVTREKAVGFVLGGGTAQGLTSVAIGVLTGDVVWAVSGAVFAVVFVGALIRIRQKATAALDGRDA
jgi:hypothetical protein